MASLPPQQASQRRNSPPESGASQARLPRANSEAISTISEDSQTVLLNGPPQEETESVPASASKGEPQAAAAPLQPDDEDVRKCWICFNDETEDTPLSSEWKSPCPCALVAHEACLLDWIADMEAPTSRRAAGSSKEIRCPQCKTEIHLSRPRSVVVDAVRAWDEFSGFLIVPWGLVVVTQAVHSASFVHGLWTIFTVFGNDDAKKILQPLINFADACDGKGLLSLLRDHWRLTIGVPFIPPILIASRTSLADSFLPVLPVVFFATSPRAADDLRVTQWPPSAAFSFAMLPYLRGAYNAYHDIVWGKLERQWLKEIQPRVRQGDDIDIGAEVAAEDEAEMLEINVDIVEEWDENEEAVREHEQQQGRNAQEGVAPPLDAPPQDGAEAAPVGGAPEADAAAGQNPAPRHRREHRGFNMILPTLVDTVLGALVFPGVAAAMGQLLKFTLPKSLTTIGPGRKPMSLLQARWGRSIVGGCMFVVLKDAMMLYVRWRMAQSHRRRKVLNYDKKTKKIIPDAEHSRRTFF